MGVCVDRLFRVAPYQGSNCVLWQGLSSSLGSFRKVVQTCINDGTITEPGVYCIIRLDRTVDDKKLQELSWVCTIDEDMVIREGLITEQPQPTRVTHWPPKA